MGVPWTSATGFVNVQNSFFADRLTLDEMYGWVFDHGNPVLVAATQVASRACAFMRDVTAGTCTLPDRDWLHRMIYTAFWFAVCMTERPDAGGAEPLPPEELPDMKGVPAVERLGEKLLSEQELYTLCEERLVSLAVGGCAVHQKLPVYRVPPIVHPAIRGTPRNTEFLKARSRWSATARKGLGSLPPPTSACFGTLSRAIADHKFDPQDLRSPLGHAGMDEAAVNAVLKEIGVEKETNGASLAQKKAFLCCACFSLMNVGETDCHVFVQAVMGTGGLATMSCPHGYNWAWKFLCGGAESVRDSKDLLKSVKCWAPLTLMDVPCGEVSHLEANEPANARKLWGSKRGCWRKFDWEGKADLSPISIPEYAAESRARRLAEIADAPNTATLLKSRGELLLERHPLMPPVSGERGAHPCEYCGRLMMCDAFHQGLGSLSHKGEGCRQHNFRMCIECRDIPTTFMESINKVDKLHLRSVCVQDPGAPHHCTRRVL
jgi:hypothetical protein